MVVCTILLYHTCSPVFLTGSCLLYYLDVVSSEYIEEVHLKWYYLPSKYYVNQIARTVK